jgi:3-oxoacyl-(acyl-carrier-protein) synthase
MNLGERSVVVTGVGLVVPGASCLTSLWHLLSAGETALTLIDRFPPDDYTAHYAGIVDSAVLDELPRRKRKQMDRFAQLSALAARRALADAGFSELVDAERAGIFVGNMFGGWEITEPSLRQLCRIGYLGISPYVASAWFATAAQGQISIDKGFKGFAKTVSTDTASGAVAVGYAARAIAEGKADLMLAGGGEAPITPYTYAFCETSGRMTPKGYRPFSKGADGFRVGEGAVLLVLEAEESARERDAVLLARIAGFATGHARVAQAFESHGAHVLARVGGLALEEAGIAPSDLDCVALDAQGTLAADDAEAAALHELLGDAAASVPCTTAKPSTGHLLGAAAPLDIATTLLALRGDGIPGLPDAADAPRGLNIVSGAPCLRPVRNALVNARGADGTATALVLKSA